MSPLSLFLVVTAVLFLLFVIVVIVIVISYPSGLRMDVTYGRMLNAVHSSATAALTASFYPFDGPVSSYASSCAYRRTSPDQDFGDFPRTEDPVHLMGQTYSSLHELPDLRRDFISMIWLTYRSGFAAIGGSGPTSDRGWGCMLRCGQMVLANALIRKHLGREWRWQEPNLTDEEDDDEQLDSVIEAVESSAPPSPALPPSSSSSSSSSPSDPLSDLSASSPKLSNNSRKRRRRLLSPVYKRILSMFEDKKTSAYSIHQISQMGECEGKPVGTWFGPNTVAQALKKLSAYDHWNRLNIHVAMDNLVIVNEVKERVLKGQDWRPLLLFIPLRLGLTDINPVYYRALKASFSLSQTLGIIGGRPSHALYFVGCVGTEFLYLDPHTTQNAVTDLTSCRNRDTRTATAGEEESDDRGFDDSSFHCMYASRMDISQLDPSIALTFFCETEADFDSWCSTAKNVFVRGEKQPLFELAKDKPTFWCEAAVSPLAHKSPSSTTTTSHAADDRDTFADYDLPAVAAGAPVVVAEDETCRPEQRTVPNVPIEIGREAESLDRRTAPSPAVPAIAYDLDSEDMDDGFEFLG